MGPVVVETCVRRRYPGTPLGLVLSETCTVRKVAPGSPASVAGVVPGMCITHVNDTAVDSAASAKAAGVGALDLHLRATMDSSTLQRGRVVSWSDRGFGMLAPDTPLFVPTGRGDTSALHIGNVFCHMSQLPRGVRELPVNASVEFYVRVCAGDGRLRATAARIAKTFPSGVVVKKNSVEWWNVNNLHECSKVVFSGGDGCVSYTKRGMPRGPARQMVFDGDNAVSMPDIGKTVRIPWGPDRVRLLGALRALADRSGVPHNFPADVAEDNGNAEQRSGRGDGVMTDPTQRLWIGWLNPSLVKTPAKLRSTVETLLTGHKISFLRPSTIRDKLAVIVHLELPLNQLQVCELNIREHPGGVRLTIDGASGPRPKPKQQTEAPIMDYIETDVTLSSPVEGGAGAGLGLFGVAVDESCRVTAVVPGSVASVNGVFPSMKVVKIEGEHVSSKGDVDAVMQRCVLGALDGVVRVVLSVSVDSSGFLTGRVDSWSLERKVGMVVPDFPIFIPNVASAPSAVYIGNVMCPITALEDLKVTSLAPGQVVQFKARYLEGRVRVTELRVEGAVREVEEGTAGGVRVGSDMAKIVSYAPQICMMHLGGRCTEKTGNTGAGDTVTRCKRGVHTALPNGNVSRTGDVSEDAMLAKVLTRVSAAKLAMLRQQVADASRSSHGYGMQSVNVMGAWQLRNDDLEFRFRATEYNMLQNTGRAPDMIDGFHGTAEDNVFGIALHGFDPLRRSGQVFGNGEYFAKNPHVSVGYCRGGSFMFLCSLILGKQDVDHSWIDHAGYYVMKQKHGHIQCLPRYLIQFDIEGPQSALRSRLLSLGVETDDAEANLRKMGRTQRGGVDACKGRTDAMIVATTTKCLWVGWLDPELGRDDAHVRSNVCDFLQGHKVVMVKTERNGARVGAFVELAHPINQLQLAELNTRPYGPDAHCISVDDAQPNNAFLSQRRCPKLTGPGKYCRGWNLCGHSDWTETCSFRHSEEMFPTYGAELTYVTLRTDNAKYFELANEVERRGLGSVTRIRRVVNTKQEEAYESRRAFLQGKNEFVTEKELWHGTNCSVLDTVLETGLQCPSDTMASDACPRSGNKGLLTTLCGTDCRHCTEHHTWDRCHMYGMGLYFAGDTAKSHRHVRPAGNVCSLVRCRVNLGSPYLVEGNLLERDAFHNVVRCTNVSGKVDGDTPHKWDELRGHDSFYVKGLAGRARRGYGVYNDEYVIFHPAQVLPLYVVDYVPTTFP